MIDHAIVPPTWIAAFARASAFAATAPVAGSGAVPRMVRGALALSLTPAVQATLRTAPLPAWPPEILIGAAFGVTASMIASAASAAGSLIDASMAMRPFGRDSVFGGSQGPFGRLYSLAFAVLIFSSGAMTHLCSRFVDASAAVPHVTSARGAVALATSVFETSLDIAAPAIAAQFVATIASAAASRVAPRINGLMLASPAATAAVLVAALAGSVPTFHALTALAVRAASLSL